MRLNVAHASRPVTGETRNGDLAYVGGDAERGWLFGVIDSLGHGEAAARCSERAEQCLRAASTRDLETLFTELHGALHAERGAAALLCRLDGGELVGASVGNVELRVRGGRIPVVHSPGVLGHGRLRVRTFRATLAPGTRLAVFSDGISSRLDLDETRSLKPADACRVLLEQHGRLTDDATVLIADLEA